MYLYLLHEATLDDIQNRVPIFIKKYFKDADEQEAIQLIEQLAAIDPTKGKYTEWLIRQYLGKKIRIPEDNRKLTALLKSFHKNKARLQDRDINSYTPGSLAKALDEIPSSKRQIKKAGRKGQLGPLPDGAEHIRSVGQYDVVKITDPKASSILCSGTQWCTANEDTAAQDYLKYGPLYLVYKNSKRYALVHIESTQVVDIYNQGFEVKEKFKLLDIIGFDYSKHPKWACVYARYIIKGRWPEGEKAIAQDAYWAHFYAVYVIKGRFPEGEAAIAQDAEWAYWYARDIIKGRFPEAEEVIAQDAEWAYKYARYVIEGRFPEGEEAIAQDEKLWAEYREKFID